MDDIKIPRIDTSKAINQIEEFIKLKIEESGSEGVVLGLSGGIDSTVVAYLSKRALGASNVLGIIMPSLTTSSEDVEHAQVIAEILGIEYEIIHIDSLIEPFHDLCSHESNELARANLKARIRMMILYYHSNSLNRLVAGTGNLSELLVGYFTKYGDGGVDILPIGDLYKTHVREVARKLEVPEEIIEKPPTAGLWPGQTDEEELGMKYTVLDEILHLMVDKSLDANLIAEKVNLPLSEIQRIVDRVKSSQHKLCSPEVPPLRE
jgi:NAD+ synthase